MQLSYSKLNYSAAQTAHAPCTMVQSAVLRLHVVRLSVRPSVRLVPGGSESHRLEIWET